MLFKFSDEAQKLLLLSLKEKNKLNDSLIGTEHIFLAILSMKNNYICKLLNENGITYDAFLSFLHKKDKGDKSNYYIFTPLMNDIFNSLSENHNKKNSEISVSDIITAIIDSNNSKVIYILKKMNIDIRNLIKSLNITNKKKTLKKGILNELGINLNEKYQNSDEVVLGRDEEINMIVEILCCKNKNNPLLIGDAGVGKTAIVEELARKINEGDIPYKLKNKKIYSVAMSSLVAGTKYRGEFEEKINKLINEVETSDDVILFIDEIHTLVGAGGADGAIDASNILKPYLARGNIKIIGATTKEEYKKYIADDKALSRRFQIVNIDEPDLDKVKTILLGIRPIYEKYHNVKISDIIIDKIIYYSNKYLNNRKFPDKAIDILDEVSVLASIFYNKEYNEMVSLDKEINNIINLKNKALIEENYKEAIKYSHNEKKLQQKMGRTKKNIFNHNKIIEVDEEILLKVMERKTNIPFYTYHYQYNKINKKINKYKSSSIYNDKTITKIVDFTKEVYENLVNSGISRSLFVKSSKLGLNNYFIDNYIKSFFPKTNTIRVDVNNFRNIDDLLNDTDTSHKNITFIDKVKSNSFSIIVIDDYDKCDYSIKDFFAKIDKYGYYIDRHNEKIDFSNVLFIYSTLKSEQLGFNNEQSINKHIFCLDVEDISSIKLRKQIKDICLKNNYYFDNKMLQVICNKVLLDYDNFNNLEFIINKEFSNNSSLREKNKKIVKV